MHRVRALRNVASQRSPLLRTSTPRGTPVTPPQWRECATSMAAVVNESAVYSPSSFSSVASSQSSGTVSSALSVHMINTSMSITEGGTKHNLPRISGNKQKGSLTVMKRFEERVPVEEHSHAIAVVLCGGRHEADAHEVAAVEAFVRSTMIMEAYAEAVEERAQTEVEAQVTGGGVEGPMAEFGFGTGGFGAGETPSPESPGGTKNFHDDPTYPWERANAEYKAITQTKACSKEGKKNHHATRDKHVHVQFFAPNELLKRLGKGSHHVDVDDVLPMLVQPKGTRTVKGHRTTRHSGPLASVEEVGTEWAEYWQSAFVDVLGVSGVLIHPVSDLLQHRVRDSYDCVLVLGGASGIGANKGAEVDQNVLELITNVMERFKGEHKPVGVTGSWQPYPITSNSLQGSKEKAEEELEASVDAHHGVQTCAQTLVVSAEGLADVGGLSSLWDIDRRDEVHTQMRRVMQRLVQLAAVTEERRAEIDAETLRALAMEVATPLSRRLASMSAQ